MIVAESRRDIDVPLAEFEIEDHRTFLLTGGLPVRFFLGALIRIVFQRFVSIIAGTAVGNGTLDIAFI